MKRIIVGLTGASGSVYFLRLLDFLVQQEMHIHVVATEHGRQVLAHETGVDLTRQLELWSGQKASVTLEESDDLFSPIASGSYRCDAMVILPCSMSTMAEIAAGVTRNLLTRAADVMIKERRRLTIVPRETPLSAVHLKNMLTLAELSVTVLPAMPGFYHRPRTLDDLVDFVVGKTLDSVGIDNDAFDRWNGK